MFEVIRAVLLGWSVGNVPITSIIERTDNGLVVDPLRLIAELPRAPPLDFVTPHADLFIQRHPTLASGAQRGKDTQVAEGHLSGSSLPIL